MNAQPIERISIRSPSNTHHVMRKLISISKLKGTRRCPLMYLGLSARYPDVMQLKSNDRSRIWSDEN